MNNECQKCPNLIISETDGYYCRCDVNTSLKCPIEEKEKFKQSVLDDIRAINPYEFDDCEGDPYETVKEQIENPNEVWNVLRFLLDEIDELRG